MKSVKKSYCCKDFQKSMIDGSDSEGYGPALWVPEPNRVQIGTVQAEVKYCPWCGTVLSTLSK